MTENTKQLLHIALDIVRGIQSACEMIFDLPHDRAMTLDVIAELAHVDAELVALLARAAVDSDNAEETLERARELALAAQHRLDLVSESLLVRVR